MTVRMLSSKYTGIGSCLLNLGSPAIEICAPRMREGALVKEILMLQMQACAVNWHCSSDLSLGTVRSTRSTEKQNKPVANLANCGNHATAGSPATLIT